MKPLTESALLESGGGQDRAVESANASGLGERGAKKQRDEERKTGGMEAWRSK